MQTERPVGRVDGSEVAAALRNHPAVDDCAVLVREAEPAGQRLVAYVVPAGPFTPGRLREALPAGAPPCAFVAVASLPRTEDGSVDEHALVGLEVLDDELVSRWEELLQAQPEVSEVAVVAQESAEGPPPLHLADVLPGWKAGPSAETPAAPPAASSEAAPAPERMAWSDGGPLHVPEGAPATLTEALLRTAREYPDRELVFVQADGGEVRQTYGELLRDARRVLSGLRASGLKAGDRAILQIDSLQGHFTAFWACALGGIIPATVAVAPSYAERNAVVNKLYNTWELLERPVILTSRHLTEAFAGLPALLDVGGLRVLAVESLKEHPPAERLHEPRPEDVIFYQLTSGSTGVPKCIQETHQAIIRHVHGSQQFNGYTPDDVTLNWLPVDHVVPILTFHLKDVYLGCRQIHVKTGLVLADPLRWLDLMEHHRVTHSWAPNFGFKLVSDALAKSAGRRWDLSALRFLMNAGEQVTLPVVREFLGRVAPFGVAESVMQPAFGMAEACTCMTYANDFRVATGAPRFQKSSLGGVLRPVADWTADDPAAVAFVDLGPPMPGVQIRITDGDNRLVPEGVIGRFQIKGGVITPGYLNNEAANREAFVGDGWFNSGDIGFIRNGRLTLTGREKEMIIVRGANFYCYEIEDVVNAVAGVEPTFAAACAVDDPAAGTEGLAVFFVPQTAATLDARLPLVRAVRAAVTAGLGISPAYVVPVPRDRFPKTTSGKIQRTQLKKDLLAGRFADLLKAIDVALGNANTLPDWFYRPVWRRKESVPPAPLPEGAALVFLDSLGLGAALGGRLERAGRTVFRVEAGPEFAAAGPGRYRLNPADPTQYRRLLNTLAEEHVAVGVVVHLWAHESFAQPADRRELEQALDRGVRGVHALLQALAAVQGPERAVRLLIAALHAQGVAADDPVLADRAALAGVVRSAAQEMSWLDCRHLDLEADRPAANAAHLWRELTSRGDREVAYRRGHRLVPRLERVDLRREPPRPLPLKRGGLYLLTGGLGGVGAEVAKYLLTQHQARLLLVGRTPLDGEGPEAAERRRAYQALAQLGEVCYVAADVCDPGALRRVVAEAEGRWRRKLDGAFHLAGVYEERLLADETPERFAAVLRPKAVGTWALHQVLQDRPGSLFVGFSSVMSFFAGAMFGAYAAANRFLEGFAHAQRRDGVPSYCLAWSAWHELGMSRSRDGKGPLRARGRGFEELTPEQGIHSLLAGLCRGPAQLLIGLDGGSPYVRRQLDGPPAPVRQLVAYVTGPADLPASRLAELDVRDAFGTRTSCRVVRVPELPRTADGGIDRNRLPEAARQAQPGRPGHVAPRTEDERRLAAIWQGLLGVSAAGIHDNFFELGGDSLMAAQVLSQVRDAFGVEVPLRALFEAPTVAGLIEQLGKLLQAAPAGQAPPLRPVPRGGELPLSFAQQRLWFIDQLSPGTNSYNLAGAFRLRGPLDVPALGRSLEEIVRRHEALRTTFSALAGRPRQVIAEPGPRPLPVTDLSHLPETAREAEARRLAGEEAARPFDLANGPLLRTTLLRLGAPDHLLLVTMHHIVSDGWSLNVFNRELGALYGALTAGRSSPLADLPVQYADYAVWQRQWQRDDVLDRQLAYWKEQLHGVPTLLELPADRPRPPVQSFRGARLDFTLDRELADRLKALSREEGATLFMTVMAAFQVLLSRYSGQEEFLVSTGVANRDRPETAPLIGCLINILLLRADLAGNPRFRDLLARAKDTALGAYAHQDVPFEQLVEELQPERDLSYNPLTQVMFVLLQDALDQLALPGLDVRPLAVEDPSSQYDLIMHLWETPQGLAGFWHYSTDLFDATTVRRMLGHFRRLLEGIAADPGGRVLDLPLLTEAERQTMLVAWNDTRWEFPRDKCLHELFEEKAAQAPDAPAVFFGERYLTYGELDRRANQLGHYLRKLGVGPDVLVGLSVERSFEMVVGMLGIMKAGGAYVPLDPKYPQERLNFMLGDTSAPVLLTQQHLLPSLAQSPARIICLDSAWPEIAKEPTERPAGGATPAHLCYVIFTSGSTGTPKGIALRHLGVVNNVVDLNRRHGVGPGDRVLCLSSLSFDMCVYEVFGMLEAGAAIVMPLPEQLREPAEWAQLMRRHRVTIWNSAPALLKMLVDYAADRPDLWPRHLHLSILGGDWCPVNLGDRLKAMAPAVRFIVLGGATEASIHSIIYDVEKTDPKWKSIPYGKPQYNQKAYVLNARLEPQPVGVAGELFLGGIGLGRGYFARPDQTADRFLPNPFAQEPGERIYRTGDLARWLPDGNIELLGRMDYQVKLRGLRIECGEIEAVLRAHPAVREAVVAAKEIGGDKRLLAYVRPAYGSPVLGRAPLVPSSNGKAAGNGNPADLTNELRGLVKEKLPDYMVPSAIVLLDEFPLSPNGKIDRKALPTPEVPAGEGRPAGRPPGTPEEEVLGRVFAEVLGVRRVGVEENFFELGGHSLLATQVISQLRETFRVELPLRTLFETPTVEGLARRVEEARQARQEAPAAPPLRPVPRDGELPLSFAQQRLWFIDQLLPGSPTYNIPFSYRLKGPLDVAAFERAVGELWRRHEVLRTTFPLLDGQPMQRIAPAEGCALSVIDLGGLPEAGREPEAERLAAEEAVRPFDLAVGPLVRTALLRLGERDHFFLMTMHHIVSDGWSLTVFTRELSALYGAFAAGRPSPLPEPALQYADYAAWQRRWLQGEVLGRQAAYWKQQLAGAPPALELPADHPRPPVQTLRGARHFFDLPPALAEGAEALGRREGTTLFMTLLSAFKVFLYAYTDRDDLVVGSPFANRNRRQVEGLMGPFVNTLVLRTRLAGRPTFRELLGRVREVVLGADAHQDFPFEKIVEVVKPPRDPSRNPLFQVNFRVLTAELLPLDLPGVEARLRASEFRNSKFDLAMELWAYGGQFGGFLEYSTDLFELPRVTRMRDDFARVLGELLARPHARPDELDAVAAVRAGRGKGGAKPARRLRDTRRRAVDWSDE